MPVISSLKRICMGWVSSMFTPGRTDKASSIASCISSRSQTSSRHVSIGFIETIMSPRSTGMGSVGISAEPIRVTTCRISGNFSNKIFSALPNVSTTWVSDVPCIIEISTVKSPSSSVGMNSPPILLKIKRLTANSATTAAMTAILKRRANSKTGA